jgi:hypothetical protein
MQNEVNMPARGLVCCVWPAVTAVLVGRTPFIVGVQYGQRGLDAERRPPVSFIFTILRIFEFSASAIS